MVMFFSEETKTFQVIKQVTRIEVYKEEPSTDRNSIVNPQQRSPLVAAFLFSFITVTFPIAKDFGNSF